MLVNGNSVLLLINQPDLQINSGNFGKPFVEILENNNDKINLILLDQVIKIKKKKDLSRSKKTRNYQQINIH